MGLFVVVTDAHLHGERKMLGIPPPTRNLGALGTDTSVWFQPSYEAHPGRLMLLEEPKTGHSVTERMWTEGGQWLVTHLIDKARKTT